MKWRINKGQLIKLKEITILEFLLAHFKEETMKYNTTGIYNFFKNYMILTQNKKYQNYLQSPANIKSDIKNLLSKLSSEQRHKYQDLEMNKMEFISIDLYNKVKIKDIVIKRKTHKSRVIRCKNSEFCLIKRSNEINSDAFLDGFYQLIMELQNGK